MKRKMMLKSRALWLAGLLIFMYWAPINAQENTAAAGFLGADMTLEEIITAVEKRYEHAGFSALFFQESTLKAMEITDSAQGRLWIKRPGKMRWDYETPEPQRMITDGIQIWIHRPGDNQVMVGKAPDFFGAGKGGAFLTDIRTARHNFTISKEDANLPESLKLKLVPKKKNQDVEYINILVDRENFEVTQILTYNIYGDETKIRLTEIRFVDEMDDGLFRFETPEGTDVLTLEGQS
ncbi:outer membrane lipoprotein carrier protein LolA [Desulfobacterales bacterium HSG17]|nr:outer membrane lipoprotein carrier protein LolA [Desulfobacterales bacterium HSG17]